jgi:hypothetical protein
MISFWFFLPNTVYRKASTFKDTFKMTFGEFRIRVESQRGYTEWTWDKFYTFLESPHFIHLYFDAKSFFLVPKAALEKEGLLDDVRRLLNEKIPRKK